MAADDRCYEASTETHEQTRAPTPSSRQAREAVSRRRPVSPDGKLVAAMNDGKLRLWSVDDGTLVREIDGVIEFAIAPRGGWIATTLKSATQFAVAPDGRRISTTSKSGVRLWPLHPPFGMVLGAR